MLVAIVLALSGAARAAEPALVLHLLDYIAVDYAGAVDAGQVKDSGEYQEMQEFAGQAQALIADLPQNPARPALHAGATELARLVAAKAAAAQVAAKAGVLRDELVRAYHVPVAPTTPPDPVRGAALYAAHCAACHGAQGHGDGPAARALDPAPSDFHDLQRMARRSAHGLYNTITLGVDGTAMKGFAQFSDADRWALAYVVAGFGGVTPLPSPPAAGPTGTPHPTAALDFATRTLAASAEAYRQGDRAAAGQLAIRAYLEGFELAEAGLHTVDADLLARTERAMMDFRGLLQAGAPVAEVERRLGAVQELLAQARERLGSAQASPAATFVASSVILLREGAEAILVVAAMLGFLARAGRAEARRWIHAGWLAALALGGLTWFVSRELIAISGADREMTEGVTALLSAAMLLYVGYWLHSRSNSLAWQKFIGDRLGGAISAGTLWTLSLVSFLAVYREAFETVLFYQALAAQAGPQGQGALLGGVAAGAVLLAVLAWTLLRASLRVPLGLFFSASGIVLLVLAVVFTGQGVAALQEAGTVAADPAGSLRLPLLGLYPTVQTLAAQALALVVAAAVVLRTARRRATRAQAAAAAS